MIHRVVVTVAAAALVTSACSSKGPSAPRSSSSALSTSSSSPVAPSVYRPQPGDDAAIIATHITGCSGVLAGDIGNGGQADMSSTATCTLDGHLVIVDSFTQGADDIASLTSSEIYYAVGTSGSWVAFLADQGAAADETTLQMQLTNDASGLTQQALNGGGHPVASLDAQQQLAAIIAKDLGGTVSHAPPAPTTS